MRNCEFLEGVPSFRNVFQTIEEVTHGAGWTWNTLGNVEERWKAKLLTFRRRRRTWVIFKTLLSACE
jgi:hypothetical protein